MDKDLTLDDLTREELTRLIRKLGFFDQKDLVWVRYETAQKKAEDLLDKSDEAFNASRSAFAAWQSGLKKADTYHRAALAEHQAEANYQLARKRADSLFGRWSALAKAEELS